MSGAASGDGARAAKTLPPRGPAQRHGLRGHDSPEDPAPARAHRLFEHPVTQQNLRVLSERGVRVVDVQIFPDRIHGCLCRIEDRKSVV